MLILHTLPLARLPEFVFGLLLGKLFLRVGDDYRRWMKPGLTGAAAILASVFLFGERLPYPLLHNGLLAPVHGMLIVGLASGGGAVARFLASRPMQTLGDASLPLYLLHKPMLLYVQLWVGGPEAGSPRFMMIVVAAYLIGTVLLSILTGRWFVEPLAQRIRRRYAAPLAAPMVPSPRLPVGVWPRARDWNAEEDGHGSPTPSSGRMLQTNR
jgi:peptidoglycan/LPS O-acetylase OafA/YrhL